LIVDRPFAAQLPPKPEPKEGKKNDDRSESNRVSVAERSRFHDSRRPIVVFLVIGYQLKVIGQQVSQA